MLLVSTENLSLSKGKTKTKNHISASHPKQLNHSFSTAHNFSKNCQYRVCFLGSPIFKTFPRTWKNYRKLKEFSKDADLNIKQEALPITSIPMKEKYYAEKTYSFIQRVFIKRLFTAKQMGI